MLPDYSQIKKLLFDVFLTRIEAAQNNELGIFSEIPTSHLFEGRRTRLLRADGSSDESDMQEVHVSTELKHDIREIETLSLEKILAMLDDVGRKMAQERMKQLLAVADKAAKEVGNVGNIGGPEAYLEMLDKLQTDFDVNGQIKRTQVLVGSEEGKKRMLETFRQIEADPKLQKRYDQIMANKLQEYRDREAARKLVD